MDELIDFGNKLFVIEDFSQCLNGEYNKIKVGNGDVGVIAHQLLKT